MTAPQLKTNPRWRWLAWALIALVGALGIGYWRHGTQSPPPSVSVQGGDSGGLARATIEVEGFDREGVRQLVEYAHRSGAQALLVTHHTHLVIEEYAAGTDANSSIDGGAMAELLAALAAGAAVRDYGMPEPQGTVTSDALATAIAAASHMSYPQFLSRQIWQPLNAATAQILLPAANAPAPAGCCLQARVVDWLRLAELLMADGRFEGTQVLPAGWALRLQQPLSTDPGRGFGLWLAGSARGAEPYIAHDVVFVRGLGQTRLWMAPHQQLAILLIDQRPAGGSGDETRLPNMVFRALRESPSGTHQNLSDLVPNH